LHDTVIATRTFDGDQTIAELVLLEREPDLGDSGVEGGARMLDYRRGKEQATVKVAQEKLGAGFGAVKADHAEVLGTNLLHAGMEYTACLADRGGSSAARRTMRGTSAGHRRRLQEKKARLIPFLQLALWN
jgi:hypothetical protein